MSRWSVFHAPGHSAAFAMDRQFRRRDMDAGVKKDTWSVMEDFSKAPGVKDLSKMKAQYEMFVDDVGSKQVTEYSMIYLGTHTDVIVTDNIGCTVSF